jgi:hypothetical protein
MQAAEQLGAQTVVVHPPFRWRRYAEGSPGTGRRARGPQQVAVENMFRSAPTRFWDWRAS